MDYEKKGTSDPVPGAQPPDELHKLRIGKPASKAAGLKAVAVSMGHVQQYMHKSQAVKTLFKLNQKGGIDCPGCAWPDPDDERSKLGEYCENGVKAIAEEASKKSIGATFFRQHSVAELRTWSDFQLGKQGRLREPLYLPKGATHYQPITWEQAYQRIASHLRALPNPDEAIFYTSGRTSNEAAFLYQTFVRSFGTNNLPDCSNLCHESSGIALTETLGTGKGSVRLTDFYEAELVLVVGQNPGTNHPRMLSALERCKENGGQIISINPLPEAGLIRFVNPQRIGKMLGSGTALTDLFLPVRINGDVALLKAIMKLLFYEEKKRPGAAFDWDFIQKNTQGYEAFIKDLERYDFNDLVDACGVPRELIKQAAEMIRRKERIIICWAMGLTQHVNAIDNIREVVNLLLLKGSIGKPGAGTCPVRGHSNVQGNRTVGIWERPSTAFLDAMETYTSQKMPRKRGYVVVDAITAMERGEASVFLGLGGNFLSASPDTDRTAAALQRCALTAQISTKLNRSHLIHGDEALILPCLARTDLDVQTSGPQFVSVENSMGVVHSSQGVLPPISEHLHSEVRIVAEIASATQGEDQPIAWRQMANDYAYIREAIEAVVPGFEAYNERVKEPGGFHLPNPVRQQEFPTASGKAQFSVNSCASSTMIPGQFLLMSIRSHDQYNTTIYGLDDRYRGIYQERRVVLMSQQDMDQIGLSAKSIVDLVSHHNGEQRRVNTFQVVPYAIPQGCLGAYFPEVNALVPLDQQARGSKTPASKSITVEVIPA